MKRRAFLTSLGALFAAPLLPAAAPSRILFPPRALEAFSDSLLYDTYRGCFSPTRSLTIFAGDWSIHFPNVTITTQDQGQPGDVTRTLAFAAEAG